MDPRWPVDYTKAMGRRDARVIAACISLLGGTACCERIASAQPPDPALLARLSTQAEGFDAIFKRATFKMDKVIDELDGGGKVTSHKVAASHVVVQGDARRQIVDRCIKDGEDCTAEAQKEAREDEADKKKDDSERLRSPFEASQQSRYVFDQQAVDQADPSRVKITFSPKNPDKHSVEGEAWVDTRTGTVLSASVRLVKAPAFVDWVHVTLELGASTPLGPALSRLTIEAAGGFLFLVHKHFRAEISFSDYHL
jgi:hypothetical protein